jgi:hypothetical protein
MLPLTVPTSLHSLQHSDYARNISTLSFLTSIVVSYRFCYNQQSPILILLDSFVNKGQKHISLEESWDVLWVPLLPFGIMETDSTF